MDEVTARALDGINRVFYETWADDFSATREAPWRGWERLVPHVLEAADGATLRVLDVGCGNGRLAGFLGDRLATRQIALDYHGVDASARLLALARERETRASFTCGDFAATPGEALPPGPFGLVALFGVLHCVAGRARRRHLLEVAAERLAAGGVLAVARWRFAESERFGGKRIPWETWNARAEAPVDPEALEPGDHLLSWGAQGAVRYCHAVDPAELDALTKGLPLSRVDLYRADGREADLNEYAIFRAATGGGRLG